MSSEKTTDLLALADELCRAACEICNQGDTCDPYRCADGTVIARQNAH